MIASLADQPGGDGPVGPGSQGNGAALPWATSLAIALGANLGDPFATLVAVRPLLWGLLERLLEERGPAGSLLGSQASGSGGSGCGGLARPEAAPTDLDLLTTEPLSPSGPEPGPKTGPEPCAQRSLIRLRWSPLFRTEPVGGPPGQPAYLNGVVLVEGVAALEPRPLALLQGLQALEAQLGRQRLEAWGPRTLDLDLLWWGDQRVQSAPLELPHPRLQERSFVLAPLAAIDPRLVPPGPAAAGGPSPSPGLACGALLAALLPQVRQAAPQRLPGGAGWPE